MGVGLQRKTHAPGWLAWVRESVSGSPHPDGSGREIHSRDHTSTVAVTLQHNVQQRRQIVWVICFTMIKNLAAMVFYVNCDRSGIASFFATSSELTRFLSWERG
jgi:hypothetical protein